MKPIYLRFKRVSNGRKKLISYEESAKNMYVACNKADHSNCLFWVKLLILIYQYLFICYNKNFQIYIRRILIYYHYSFVDEAILLPCILSYCSVFWVIIIIITFKNAKWASEEIFVFISCRNWFGNFLLFLVATQNSRLCQFVWI